MQAPRHQCAHRNVFHCTVQRSGSHWLRAILSDPRTYEWSGLTRYPLETQFPQGVDPRKLTERTFPEPFPANTILTPLYLDYACFQKIPKPGPYRVVFVHRDPRDVVVSWYFSVKHSHAAHGEVARIRWQLAEMSSEAGLLYAIDYVEAFGLFEAQRSWLNADDPNVLLVRFEEMIAPGGAPVIEQILQHCDIRMPRSVLTAVLDDYSFTSLSGRLQGDEDRNSHYRKGMAGDWRAYFTDRIAARFKEAGGDMFLETSA
jgi:hypothetical protein